MESNNEATTNANLKKKKTEISYSQYSLFIQCKYRWKLKYIDKIKIDKPTISLVYGSAMHATIQKYLKTLFKNSIIEADELDIEGLLLDEMKKEYIERREKNGGKDFSSSNELTEYYADGIKFLKWFKEKKLLYFPRRYMELLGIELQINFPIKNNVHMNGYLDLVIKDHRKGKIEIVDIKTSNSGWNSFDFKDEIKLSQLVFYKFFYSKQFDVSKDDIDVRFLIISRKGSNKIQEHRPSTNDAVLQKHLSNLENFIEYSFDADGNPIKDKNYPASPSIKNCRFCEYYGTVHCPFSSNIIINNGKQNQ